MDVHTRSEGHAETETCRCKRFARRGNLAPQSKLQIHLMPDTQTHDSKSRMRRPVPAQLGERGKLASLATLVEAPLRRAVGSLP